MTKHVEEVPDTFVTPPESDKWQTGPSWTLTVLPMLRHALFYQSLGQTGRPVNLLGRSRWKHGMRSLGTREA
jgi:hypothetical protein